MEKKKRFSRLPGRRNTHIENVVRIFFRLVELKVVTVRQLTEGLCDKAAWSQSTS